MHRPTAYVIGVIISLTSYEPKLSPDDLNNNASPSSQETKIETPHITLSQSQAIQNNSLIQYTLKSQPVTQPQTPTYIELPPSSTSIQDTQEPIESDQITPTQNQEDIPLEDRIKTYIETYPQNIETQQTNKKIVICKQQHLLEIYLNDQKLKSYTISLGDFLGDKEKEGDNKTPEGTYYIVQKNPDSKFHKALLLNYPAIEDAKRGESEGVINQYESNAIKHAEENCQLPPQTTALGSYIEIHGGRDQRESQDWTWGCIALKNAEMDEIYAFAEQGCSDGQKRTIIEINP